MKKKYKILALTIIILSFSLNTTGIFAQKEFLLNGNEMGEYKLKKLDSIYWPSLEMPKIRNVIQQIWKTSKGEEYYIEYYKFNNEEEAITTTSFAAKSFSMPFVMGTPTGKLIGDFSWVSLDQSSMYFQNGNLGIKIFTPVNFEPEMKTKIDKLSEKLLVKIKKNITSEIINNDNNLLKNRITEDAYKNKTTKSSGFLAQNGYLIGDLESSKWMDPKSGLKMGIRKQWTKSNSCISIDIIELSNETQAQDYLKTRGALTFSPVCSIDSDESIQNAIEELNKKWGNGVIKYVSIIGQKDKTLIHFYYYNEKGINMATLKELIKSTRI